MINRVFINCLANTHSNSLLPAHVGEKVCELLHLSHKTNRINFIVSNLFLLIFFVCFFISLRFVVDILSVETQCRAENWSHDWNGIDIWEIGMSNLGKIQSYVMQPSKVIDVVKKCKPILLLSYSNLPNSKCVKANTMQIHTIFFEDAPPEDSAFIQNERQLKILDIRKLTSHSILECIQSHACNEQIFNTGQMHVHLGRVVVGSPQHKITV